MGEEKASQYQDTPGDWARRWKVEFNAARKAQEQWRKQGVDVDKVYRDEREDMPGAKGEVHWNLYTSTEQTIEAMLFGNTPKVDVGRRFADANDDVARVAGEVMERLLNSDFEKSESADVAALQYSLQDRLIPGCGVARVRYSMEEEEVPGAEAQLHPLTGQEIAPAVPPTTRRKYECVETDYVHWQDFLWSPARTWHEVRWVAFRNPLTREQLVKRFGEKVGSVVPLGSLSERKSTEENRDVDPWARADVWEIWLKEEYTPQPELPEEAEAEAQPQLPGILAAAVPPPEAPALTAEPAEGRVFWFVEGHPYTLDDKADPLGLEGFWPCPRPMFANTTTSKLVPRPDYVLAQDFYTEINSVSTRIDWLQKAIKVVGTYDVNSPEVARLLSEAVQNQLLPSKSWQLFKEKGGMGGAMEFLPIGPVVEALMQLRDYRRELVDMLYQVTGQADIMRGAASAAGASATEQSIKARFGSVRIQRLQDEFARFATDIQRLKAEVISKHFQPESILEQSNAKYAFSKGDQQCLPQAIQLLKSELGCYRIEVKSESVSMADMASLKSERTEVIGSLAQFMQAAAPLAQAMPGSMPFLLQLLQAVISTVRGSSVMEGILDAAIAQMEQQHAQAAAQPKQPPPPDPKLQAAQLKQQSDAQKAQADMQKEQFKHQADMERIQAETVAHDQQEQSQARWNTQEQANKALINHTYKTPPTPSGGGFP